MRAGFQEWAKGLGERIEANERKYSEEAIKLHKRHIRIGIVAIVLTGIASATLFVNSDNTTVQYYIGIVGIIAGVLTAVQTFVNYGQLSEACHGTATRYGQVRRELERLEHFEPKTVADQEQVSKDILDELKEITDSAPIIPGLGEIDLLTLPVSPSDLLNS